MTPTRVALDRLLFGAHDMSWEHVERWLATPTPHPPVQVERLPNGYWFVHDGRHRATAAYERGSSSVPVEVVRF